MRNIVVIAIGVTPLLFSSLVPFRPLGVFQATVMLFAGLTTLWLLPALLPVMRGWLFKKELGSTATSR